MPFKYSNSYFSRKHRFSSSNRLSQLARCVAIRRVKMKVELFLDPEDMPMREFYFQFVRRRLVTVVQYIYPFKSHFTNMAQHQFIDIDGSVLEGVNILLNFSTSQLQ